MIIAKNYDEFAGRIPLKCVPMIRPISSSCFVSSGVYSYGRVVPTPMAPTMVSLLRIGTHKRTADAGLLCAGPGHATGVCLQIANRYGPALRNDLSGDAFADGNGFDDLEHLRWQANLCCQMQQLFLAVEQMNRTGFRMKMFKYHAKRLFQNSFLVFAAIQQRRDLIEQLVHGEMMAAGAPFSKSAMI